MGAISNTFFEQDYLWGLLESDIMPLVDVISWHPMYGASPDYPLYYDYYYDYPKMLQRIKDTAAAHGFDGEYHADELSWNLEYRDDQPWVYTPVTAAKYFGRAALLHLGTQIDIGLGGGYIVTPRLTTVMAGAEPIDLQVEKETTAEYMPGYSFSLPDNGYLVSMWTNGVAQESDPGVLTTITIPGFSAEKVIAVDILYGLEQELVFEQVGADLIIRDLLVRDYPLILKFESGER